MTRDKVGFVNEIKSYRVDQEVNWFQLSIKYGIKDGKGMRAHILYIL